ncbi:MAPEG family protein [Roseovarius aestuarii]|uniref:MAPEG family protein n=1 Tax=Roseovarius aestuarii TaxID=475083 RepID=A0A1X7BMW1_9RHOB|nr:MAPEG family protein [Roseovarius aestuarii]SMC10884.1 MAPEG family protein [Roseovarius aestuarii]
MEHFATYGHAIVAMAATAIFGLLLSPLSAMRKSAIGLAPGCEPEADYSSSVYRWHRAYANLSETIGFFVACVAAAILAGASPFWVNLFASIFFVSRLVLAVIHIGGIGKPDMSARSFLYVAGWLMCVLLAIMAIFAVL